MTDIIRSDPAAPGKARSKLSRKPKVAAAPEPIPTSFPAPRAPKGKLGHIVELLSAPDGATIEALAVATGWQAHSVRGAISGALKKKLGLAIVSEKTDAGRVYRITPGSVA